MTKAMTPKTLREAAMILFLQLRAIVESRAFGDFGAELAGKMLRGPDPLEMVALVTTMRLSGDRDGAQQLLESISLIVAGGWRAVLDDPEASKAWARAIERLG